MIDPESRPIFFCQSGGKDLEGQFLLGIGVQDGRAHAIERFLKRQICIDSRADERGVRQRPDHALHPLLRAVGHCGGDANVGASAPSQQQCLEPR